jgi:hypothetical protein
MIRFLYRRFFQTIDTALTLTVSLLITWAILRFNLFQSLSDDLLQTMIESLIGLLGLVMAFMAIIFSFNESKKLKYFKETGSFATVMDIIVNAIVWISLSVGILVLMSLLSINIPTNIELGLFVSACLMVIVKTGRCVWITRKLFDLSIK